MKKNILWLCLFCSSFSISAQLPPQFLQNPAISWAAEFELDIVLTPPIAMDDSLQTQTTQSLKLIMHPDSFAARLASHQWFPAQLFNAIRTQKLKLYSDNLLQKPAFLTETNWNWEKNHLFPEIWNRSKKYPADPRACSHLRVRQIIYYDSVKVNWNLYNVSVGFGFRFQELSALGSRRLDYWIPVQAQLSPFEQPAVTWAMRFKTTPITHLEVSKVKVLKGMNDILQHFVAKAKSDSKLPLWTRDYHLPISEKERSDLKKLLCHTQAFLRNSFRKKAF